MRTSLTGASVHFVSISGVNQWLHLTRSDHPWQFRTWVSASPGEGSTPSPGIDLDMSTRRQVSGMRREAERLSTRRASTYVATGTAPPDEQPREEPLPGHSSLTTDEHPRRPVRTNGGHAGLASRPDTQLARALNTGAGVGPVLRATTKHMQASASAAGPKRKCSHGLWDARFGSAAIALTTTGTQVALRKNCARLTEGSKPDRPRTITPAASQTITAMPLTARSPRESWALFPPPGAPCRSGSRDIRIRSRLKSHCHGY
jgi:hypothetical protein